MSKESANQFLLKASHDLEFQHQFEQAGTPEEFLKLARELGYDFTSDELREIVKEHSEGVTLRRHTGIWTWLRSVKWI